MRNNESIENYASKLKTIGLKRHLTDDIPELNDVHHYVIELEYQKSEEDDLLDDIPDCLEVCCDNEHSDGRCDATYMFYLEDQVEEDVDHIIDWLKSDKHWKSYED